MPKVVSQTKKIYDLTLSERATMYGLLSLMFLGVNRQDFLRDLAEKDVVMLLRKDSLEGEIVGFSTLMLLDLRAGFNVKAVFSGDTVVLEEYRTSIGFGIEAGKYFKHVLAKYGHQSTYYVLISKGWRTYRIMPFTFKSFAPKHDAPTSVADKAVMDTFGRRKYPFEYDSATGLIMFDRETQRVIPGSSDALPPPEPDEHVRYFLAKNPTYLSGTELVCVAPIRSDNFAAGMERIFRCTKEER